MTGLPSKVLPIAMLLPLAACATGDMADYPSLAQRPVERRLAVPPPPVVAPEPVPVSATLEQALAALLRDAQTGDAAFRAALAEFRPVAAGLAAAPGSEEWAVAQRALSRADIARGPTRLALAELDRLAIDQLQQGGAADAVAAVQAEVAALVAEQNRAMAALGG